MPAGSEPLFRRVVIAGVGLLGGSLGMALRRDGLAGEVVGWGRSAQRLDEAVRLGAIDRYQTDLAAAVEAADLVVLATPVGTMPELLQALAGVLLPGGPLITDLGSVKAPVVEAALQAGLGEFFLGGHPMAGKAESGVAAAEADLFRGCRWVVTPHPLQAGDAVSRLRARLLPLLQALQAQPMEMPPEQHDQAVAAISHLPQVVASSLMRAAVDLNQATPGALRLAAGGFRDTTRIAASDPLMWRHILASNRAAVLQALDVFQARLGELRTLLEQGDGERIEAFLQAARAAKRGMTS